MKYFSLLYKSENNFVSIIKIINVELVSGILQFFAALSSTQHFNNYFDGPINSFSDLYLIKFLDTSAKPFLS